MATPVSLAATPAPAAPHAPRDRRQVDCCIVGGGPAGAVLALLLARQGLRVELLEEHLDFDRDFRGDTLHPTVMEIMDQLGLAERLLQLRHTKAHTLTVRTQNGSAAGFSFERLPTKFPYITLMPQTQFLEFVTTEAGKYPDFRLTMGANVQELVEEDGLVRGVRYRSRDGWHEVRALLVVGADGRFSRLRRLTGFQPITTSAPMDVLWFRLSRRPDDPEGLNGRFGRGHLVVLLDRWDYWQVGFVIPKGTYQQLRAAGLDALRRELAATAPEIADRIDELQDWRQVSLLSVESNRLPRWYKPGLLLIGDAAHVMTPVGGVGINYAIQDAVVAANLLTEPLQRGRVSLRDLAAVQRQRELPIRFIQAFQSFIQQRVLQTVLDPNATFQFPPLLRLPILRDIPPRLIGIGLWPVRLKT
jgi:2-polyprenyl-6-methoxyphenol hydroxylase-like FAD-dependent oxidoreductase